LFRPAFYFAVKDTLVVQDIEYATRLVFNSGNDYRHRVVTMKGEVVEPSGTMSGGGRPRSGAMNSKPMQILSNEDVEAMNKRI